MTTMHISHRQEAFSRAYVCAVAAAAGFRVQAGADPDDDSVDLTIAARGPGGTVRSPKLDVQLKCLLGQPDGDPHWPYDLKLKNYNDLRHEDYQVPRILIIVTVPDDPAQWLDQDDDRLLLRHCGWWVSLRGKPATTNTTKVRVDVPRIHRFNVAGLAALMDLLGEGRTP